jgi:tagatose 1,6-diphosphate aldolase GatY/KbaY
MFVPIKIMYDYARDNNFCVSRFLVTNLESVEAAARAAEATNSPVLFDVYLPMMEDSCLGCLEDIAKRFINTSSIPAGLWCDHIESVDECIKAIDRGYDGVMIDLSRISFEENVKGSKIVVDYAHKKGVFVEGEVGVITKASEDASSESGRVVETDPREAEEYVKRTGVDALALSIGVQSGFYKGEPDINYKLIKELSKLDVHLCLHGASGLSKEIVRKCIDNGMHSTGYGTDPLFVFFKTIDEIRRKEGEKFLDTSKILIPARDSQQKEIEEKISYIKSNNRGREIINIYKSTVDYEGYKSDVSYTNTTSSINNAKCSINNKNNDLDKVVKAVTNEVLRQLGYKK